MQLNVQTLGKTDWFLSHGQTYPYLALISLKMDEPSSRAEEMDMRLQTWESWLQNTTSLDVFAGWLEPWAAKEFDTLSLDVLGQENMVMPPGKHGSCCLMLSFGKWVAGVCTKMHSYQK